MTKKTEGGENVLTTKLGEGDHDLNSKKSYLKETWVLRQLAAGQRKKKNEKEERKGAAIKLEKTRTKITGQVIREPWRTKEIGGKNLERVLRVIRRKELYYEPRREDKKRHQGKEGKDRKWEVEVKEVLEVKKDPTEITGARSMRKRNKKPKPWGSKERNRERRRFQMNFGEIKNNVDLGHQREREGERART